MALDGGFGEPQANNGAFPEGSFQPMASRFCLRTFGASVCPGTGTSLPSVRCFKLGRAGLLWVDRKRQNRNSCQETWGSGGKACPSSGPFPYLYNVDRGSVGLERKGGLRRGTLLGGYRRHITEGPLCALAMPCRKSPTLSSPTGLSEPSSSEPGSITIYRSYDISDLWARRSSERSSYKKGAQRTSPCRAGPEFAPMWRSS